MLLVVAFENENEGVSGPLLDAARILAGHPSLMNSEITFDESPEMRKEDIYDPAGLRLGSIMKIVPQDSSLTFQQLAASLVAGWWE